jgi:hypothetical protein
MEPIGLPPHLLGILHITPESFLPVLEIGLLMERNSYQLGIEM